ncbi:MAG: alpha/beta hydrolase [Bdellovibrionota bacterium]
MLHARIRLVLLLVSGLLCGLAINTLLMTSARILWILALLVSENGHWFALLTLILLAVAVRSGSLGTWTGRVALVLMATGLALFATPIVQAAGTEAKWRKEFDETFGTLSGQPWFRWSKLVSIPIEIPKFERITFRARDGATIAYDLYRGDGVGKRPVVVVVHGGGWDSGDSSQLPELNLILNHAGYSVASIDYRLAPGAKWPVQRHDVEDSILDMKAKAEELQLDMSGVYVLGRSAGGQIAGALAFIDPPVCIKGLIAFYAPTDLTFGYEISEEDHWLLPRLLIRQLMGGEPMAVKENYRTASLIENVSAVSPPTLLLHGRPDSLTWFKHSERLDTRLRAAGVKSYFLDLPWGHHGFDYFVNGPGGQISRSAVLAFVESQKSRCVVVENSSSQ